MATAKKLPSGNWNVVVFAGKDPGTGKRIYKSFTASTKKEAEFMAADYNYNRKQLSLPQNMTLRQAYDRYIESKSNVLSPSTVREYKRSAKKDLQGLMDQRLSDLTQEKIQMAVNEAALDHSPKSVRNMHGLLSAVLSVYYPSLSLHTRLPQKDKPEIYIPSEEDVKTLLKASEGAPMHIAILLASVGPMRRSEICALMDTDITDTGVYVTKAMVKNEDKEWVIKAPKTTAGKRFIEMPPEIIRELKQIEGRIYPYTPGNITNQFRRLTKKTLGYSFKFHALRHYSASVLHAMGVPDMYIMQRGGWESRETLNQVYTHIISEEKKEFTKKIINHFQESVLNSD